MSSLRVRPHARLHPLLVALAPIAGRAQTATGRPLAIEDYYRVKTVGSPEISPDGKWVAYTVSTRVEATNGNTSEVWLAAFDGSSQPRQVGTPGEDAAGPRGWTTVGFDSRAAGAALVGRSRQRPIVRPSTGAAAGRGAGGGGRGGRGGGRGGARRRGAQESGRQLDGRRARRTPPPKRERVYESDFAKRHEERFKGVEFDWMDFQRDAAPFPLPNRVDPDINPPQEIFLTPNGGAEKQLTHLRPSARGRELESREHAARLHRRFHVSERDALRPERRLDRRHRRHDQGADEERRILVRRRAVLARRGVDSRRRGRRRRTP